MPVETTDRKRLWTRDFLLICMVGLFTSIVMQLLNTTLSIFVVSLGGNNGFSGLLATGFAVCAGVMRLVSGRLSDVHGRRSMMVLGSAVFALAVLACALFPVLPLLLLFRAVQGIGFAAVSTSSAAAAADVTPPSRMGEGLGYFGLAQSLAMAVGPGLGLLFVAGGQYGRLYAMAAGLLVLCFAFTLFCTYERRRSKARHEPSDALPPEPAFDDPRYRGIWKVIERESLPAAAIQLVFCIGVSSLTAFAGLFAVSRGFEHAGLFFSFEAVAMFASRLFSGRLFDRRGPLSVIVPSLLLGMGAFALLALGSGEAAFLACGALMGMSLGMLGPALNALAVRKAPLHRRGAASATFFIATDIGIGLGSVLWGIVLDAAGFATMFLGAAIVLGVALGYSLRAVRHSGEVDSRARL